MNNNNNSNYSNNMNNTATGQVLIKRLLLCHCNAGQNKHRWTYLFFMFLKNDDDAHIRHTI